MTSTRRSAFTLIELLVTTTVLTVLSGLTLATFAGLARVQATRTRAQSLASSAISLEEQMQDDAILSSARSIIQKGTSTLTPSIYSYFVPTNAALPLGAGEWRVYCSAVNAGSTTQATVKRLRFQQTSYVPFLLPNATDCTAAALNAGFAANAITEETLLGAKIGSLGDLRFSEPAFGGIAGVKMMRIEGILSPLDEDESAAQNQLPIRFDIRNTVL